MRILALIPARGGSKRLPGKNKRLLGGKPLIVWSIDAVKNTPEVCDILVSTDDSEIAEISKKAGALVPWLRSPELATDTASSVDVALHALDWYEEEYGAVDGILLLQPTSPFRSKDFITRGISFFKKSKLYSSVVGVTLTHNHPSWSFIIESGALTPFMSDKDVNTRSQDLTPVYVLSGNFYLTSPGSLRKINSFICSNTIPLVTSNNSEVLDIDTEWDFRIAELLAPDCLNAHAIKIKHRK